MELSDYRKQIDQIDEQITRLFAERMQVSAQIGSYKKEHGLPVLDPGRERQKLLEVAEKSPKELQEYAVSLYSLLFELSRSYQNRLSGYATQLPDQIREAIQKTAPLFPENAVVAH